MLQDSLSDGKFATRENFLFKWNPFKSRRLVGYIYILCLMRIDVEWGKNA